MEPSPSDIPNATPASLPGLGLAIASLVLGIISVALSFLVMGVILGFIEALFWARAFLFGEENMACANGAMGRYSSIIGVVASLAFCAYYIKAAEKIHRSNVGGRRWRGNRFEPVGRRGCSRHFRDVYRGKND